MSESTMETPCLIILCDSSPENINKIFAGAEIDISVADRNFFSGEPELNRLNSLVSRYEMKSYTCGIVVRGYQDAQLLMAKMNLNLGPIFKFQTPEDFDKLDALFECGDLDAACEEKIDECLEYVREMQSTLAPFASEEIKQASLNLTKLLDEIRPQFSIYKDPAEKFLKSLKA